jgi:endonuclease III
MDATAGWVVDTLNREQGVLTWRSHGGPLDALIQTTLSQHTSDINSERAFDALKRRFVGGWDEVRLAPVEIIADTIRCGGLADAKAARIKTILQALFEKYGETTLEPIRAMSTDDALELLTGFHGVGPKTAACVLMFSLGRPVLPVDTHVFRVSHRLGLIDEKIGEARAHDALQAQLQDSEVYAFHVHLIRHGRRVCQARSPQCERCPLSGRCAFFRGNP